MIIAGIVPRMTTASAIPEIVSNVSSVGGFRLKYNNKIVIKIATRLKKEIGKYTKSLLKRLIEAARSS
jgi:hypothetical protein